MIKQWLFGVILGCLMLFGMSAHAQMECGERMQIEINNKIYSVVLENNMTADALRRRLPMTLNMDRAVAGNASADGFVASRRCFAVGK